MTKILTLDIETSPHQSFHFKLFNENFGLNQVREWSRVVCFSGKWYGEREVEFYSDFHNGHDKMVHQAFEMLEEADAVVTYNGDSFDLKRLNTEFDLLGLGKPKPYVSIDLYKVAKANFAYGSNKLDHIVQQHGLGEKIKTGGFPLWIGCINGDMASWSKMREYNMEDVVLTEMLFDDWKPWITNIPNFNLMNDTEDHCYSCGSTDMQKRGFKRTNIAQYQQYKCKSCGAWNVSGKAERISTMRALK